MLRPVHAVVFRFLCKIHYQEFLHPDLPLELLLLQGFFNFILLTRQTCRPIRCRLHDRMDHDDARQGYDSRRFSLRHLPRREGSPINRSSTANHSSYHHRLRRMDGRFNVPISVQLRLHSYSSLLHS